MPYRTDPQKRLAQLLHSAMNKGHKYAVIHGFTDRLVMSGSDERLLKAFAGWTPDMKFVDVRQHLATLPRISC